MVNNKTSLSLVLQRITKLPVYTSKIHLIRLNDWVIIYFIASTPSTLKKSERLNRNQSLKNSFFDKKNIIFQFKKLMFF